ncbi:MAG: hypothetical protein Kow0042_01370 [Calditrichia bacterium]
MSAQNFDGSLKIRYNGEHHQIDLNTLINSLSQMSSLIQEVNSELNIEYNFQRIVEIKVRAFQAGSFAVHLDLVSRQPETLAKYFVKEDHQSSAAIISSLVELINLKNFLKGRKPEKVELQKGGRVLVVQGNGKQMNVGKRVFTMYANNSAINEALNRNFEALERDSEIKGFEILGGDDRSHLKISPEEFKGLARTNQILIEDSRVAVIPGARLSVFKIVFHDKYKWQFYYKGIKISATINDDYFFKQIDEGMKFSKGDTLICELQINKVFDRTINTYVNSSYQINKVIEHIPRPEQVKFDF